MPESRPRKRLLLQAFASICAAWLVGVSDAVGRLTTVPGHTLAARLAALIDFFERHLRRIIRRGRREPRSPSVC
jgi:hypothetical protein